MAVVRTASIRFLLQSIFFDAEAGVGVARFARLIDDVRDQDLQVEFTKEELVSLMYSQPEPGKTRFDDITDAVYAAAITKGAISGTIT
jgi:hypothetical protein